jgi:hypothetical protein
MKEEYFDSCNPHHQSCIVLYYLAERPEQHPPTPLSQTVSAPVLRHIVLYIVNLDLVSKYKNPYLTYIAIPQN